MTTPRFAPVSAALAACALLGAVCFVPSVLGRQANEDAQTEYLTATPNDPVSRLQKRIASGELKLDYYNRHGFLRAVLRELNIPYASQTLVFSKTSFQRDHISGQSPRALYFNDDTYVGWVQNGNVLEISTTDARLGQVFYTLRQTQTERPRFERQTFECLTCHRSASGDNTPTLLARSLFTHADGNPDFGAGSFATTPQSPFHERWGGWYVTGRHGLIRHMGNSWAQGADGAPTLDTEKGANVADLRGRLNVTPYLSRGSDIVALLVLAHQIQVHNALTRTAFLTRDALRDERTMNSLDRLPADNPRSATARRVQYATEPLVQALLFSGETPLVNPVSGSPDFARLFARNAKREAQGRSLRDLDLNRRLLRYPCSYLIYSEAFNGLPTPAKTYVYTRLHEILSGHDKTPAFAHLSNDDKKAIGEILTATKPDYAAFVAAQTFNR